MMNADYATRDSTIREELIRNLELRHNGDPDSVIVSELMLPKGASRIDVAVINGSMHGYELKGDVDTLKRLAGQAWSYNLIFDKVTLVSGKSHLIEAINLVPNWWGVTLAKQRGNNSGTDLIQIRKPRKNPRQDVLSVVDLLWKNEILSVLQMLGVSPRSSSNKKTLCTDLVSLVEKDVLKQIVRKKLVERFARASLKAV